MMLMRMLTVTIGMKMHEYDNGDDVDADTLFSTVHVVVRLLRSIEPTSELDGER